MRGHEYRLLTNDEADDEGQGQAVAQDGHTGQECPQLCLRVPSLRQAELAPGDRGHRMTSTTTRMFYGTAHKQQSV